MNIQKHISALLFEHDCVIIPDFGGFVCNSASARVHAVKHQFHPPFKNISFNRSLKNNDGLLANEISQSEGISYSEANLRIAEYVEQLNKEIVSVRRFELKSIGTFISGEENILMFEQDETVNYLPEAFGLGTFYSSAIKREPIERKFERTLKDQIIIPSKDKTETVIRKRTPVVRYLAIAASVLITASLIFISLKTDILKKTDFAGLNPFGDEPTALYQPDPKALPDNVVVKEDVSNMLAMASDTTRYLNIVIDGQIPIVVRMKQEEAPAISVKTKTRTSKNDKHFHIVGGAFAVPENAEKFLSKLKALGYDARIIDKKLHMVSYGSFASREEALQAIEKIRAVQSDVWLMKI